MNPAVVCQPLSKFGMFTSVVLSTMLLIVFFSLNGGEDKIFNFWCKNTEEEEIFKGEEG